MIAFLLLHKNMNPEVIDMTREEVSRFIKAMKAIEEDWTPEEVEAEYGDLTLMEAVRKRLNKMQTFWDFVEEDVIPDLERMKKERE
jgi:hypothetical protein